MAIHHKVLHHFGVIYNKIIGLGGGVYIMRNGLEVVRQRYTNKTIIGSIYFNGDFVCYSLEDFNENIPDGEYHLFKHKYKGVTETVALVNVEKGVTHYEDKSIKGNRFLILIHSGNDADDTEGCILVGLTTDQDFVGNSKSAFKKLMRLIKQHNIKTIKVV